MSHDDKRLLGGRSPREFLDGYWQRRPLLVRGALPGLRSPLTPEELAGLACEPGVTARLIEMPRDGASWRLSHGPFDEADFARLPERGWTLLVQEVDRWIDAAADLLERFRFLPNWRIDDVMISYATDGAGVGPHVDNYDVFLVQAAGQRRWRIGAGPVEDERLIPDVDVRVLAAFEPADEWVLDPGDLLYLPARIAHDGIAVGGCMTCSIGFRAPHPAELCARWLEWLGAEGAGRATGFRDGDLDPSRSPGELTAAARDRLRQTVMDLFAGVAGFDRMLGRVLTEPARGSDPVEDGEPATDSDGEDLRACLAHGAILRRSAPPHFAWYAEDDGTIRLFVGGESCDDAAPTRALAELLCGRDRLDAASLAPHLEDPALGARRLELLARCVRRGFLLVEEPEEG